MRLSRCDGARKAWFAGDRLGLLPGAGGTQRLPRFIGARAALEFMLKGSSISAERALELGILDEVAAADLVDRAMDAYAAYQSGAFPSGTRSSQKMFRCKRSRTSSRKRTRCCRPKTTAVSPRTSSIDAVQASVELPFSFGIAREARLFDELVRSAAVAGVAAYFLCGAGAGKIPGVSSFDEACPERSRRAQDETKIEKVGVVGAGTMGSGIAIAFAQAGIPVVVVDNNDEAVDKARQTVMGMFMYQVQKGRLTQEEAWKRGQSIRFTDDWSELADADVIVEAVFENLDVKREVFRKLDAHRKAAARFSRRNTSTLDIDKMAAETKRPDRVLGLHFFVPANIMPLLEIVRGREDVAADDRDRGFQDSARRLRKKARALAGTRSGSSATG